MILGVPREGKSIVSIGNGKLSFSFTHKGQTYIGRDICNRQQLTDTLVGWVNRLGVKLELIEEIFSKWEQIPRVDNLMRSWHDC